jgi:hypothetical protein
MSSFVGYLPLTCRCRGRDVDTDEEATGILKDRSERMNFGIPLEILPSPYRELTRPPQPKLPAAKGRAAL